MARRASGPEEKDAGALGRRLLWFVGLWAAGVLAVGALAAAIRLAMGL
ncbi:MAG: DUF2474 family protein [Kiloniellales bacterium]